MPIDTPIFSICILRFFNGDVLKNLNKYSAGQKCAGQWEMLQQAGTSSTNRIAILRP